MRRWWLLVPLLLAAVAVAVPTVVLSQNTGVNPTVGSVWTYLGATYGAGWVVPPVISSGYVPNNAALAVTTLTTNQIYRAGFYAPGDGGAMTYTHQAGACSLNGGNGDGGSQVKAVDGGCWIADFSGMQPTPLVWGAKGDGTTNDRVQVQAAIDALPGKTLYIGGKKYCIGAPGLVVYKAMAIEGNTPGYPWDTTHPNFPNYGFVACAVNLNMLTFGTDGTNVSAGSRLSGVFFDAGAAGTNTSGVAITANQTSLLKIEHVVVYRACIGIDERMSNNDRISHVLIRGDGTQMAAGCGGIRVGAGSTGAQLTDLKLDSVTSDVKGDWGLWVQDAGGMQLHNLDLLFAKNGTLIKPGANQSVTWLFADNSALGDSTCQSGLVIDAGTATSVVTGLSFNGTWTASAGNGDPAAGCLGTGVSVLNTGPTGAIVRGIHFVGHRSYSNGREGFLIGPNAFDVTIDASMICNNSARTHFTSTEHYAGIAIGDGSTSIAIRNNRISPSCAYTGYLDLQTTAIFFAGPTYAITIVGNDFINSTSTISGSLPTGFTVIKDNNGLDDKIDDLPAGSPQPLGFAPAGALTGATAIISSFSGTWPGREVFLLARDATQNFAMNPTLPGRVCNARTLTVGQIAKAVHFGGSNCVYIFAP